MGQGIILKSRIYENGTKPFFYFQIITLFYTIYDTVTKAIVYLAFCNRAPVLVIITPILSTVIIII